MTFQALLVSGDDEAATVLAPVLADFGLDMRRCAHTEAIRELTEQKFDAVIVDFDDTPRAILVLQNAHVASPRASAVTVALLREPGKVRSAFGAGAHFVLYKPFTPVQAQTSLRAATILIKRERRRSLRVPVQVPVQLRAQVGLDMEGILLDLSQDGMEILASQPLCPSTSLSLQFSLPQGGAIDAHGEVAWANPNGQCGVRFLDLSEDARSHLAAWVTANIHKVPAEDSEPAAACKLTDLSLGGCYVETESPFPERSGVALGLTAAGMETQAQGMVRVTHPAFGMGIEFASRSADEREQVADFIKFLISFPGTVPELAITPLGLGPGAGHDQGEKSAHQEFDDPLLDLLRRHESLSQEDFLQELRQQRRSPALTAPSV
jgi:CheY-like chemotaxis protein